MKESDGKLTYETLRASVLNMRGPGASDAPRPPTARPLREKCTMNAKHLLDRRKMEKVAEAKDKEIKLLHKELDDLRKELLERKNVELDASDAAEQVSRRDEQLEFLMNVHDAAKDADWVSPAGAPRNAAAALKLILPPRSSSVDSGPAAAAFASRSRPRRRATRRRRPTSIR